MSILRHLTTRCLTTLATALSHAPSQSAPLNPHSYTPVHLSSVRQAAQSLFHITLDVSRYPRLAASHTRAGQYLQLRVPEHSSAGRKPSVLAIASAPWVGRERGELEFLVKSVEGTTAERVCELKRGDVVEVSEAMGSGFEVERIEPARAFGTVLMFATGTGISPIRSLIESGFDADMRPDVRLYYEALDLKSMAYQDKFRVWESSGVKVIPVLSQPDSTWTGESGSVQAAFTRAKKIFRPQSTGAVLCGHRQMIEEITSILTAAGVSYENILKNF